MRKTSTAQFSLVLATVQRAERLPGGDIRGLPNGQVVGGLKGLHSFAVELAEAEKECQQGRLRSARDRVKQLENRFISAVNHWNSVVGSLIANIRQGKHLKNLEKLKDLKAAQLNMQRLVSPAQKALQDLVTTLDHDTILKARGSTDNAVDPKENDSSQRGD
ncbi:MAG: hypothetical protein MI861_19230 [Pirellulales bacterium]|nr:hypothetical protein [Pirellulales bacterium]